MRAVARVAHKRLTGIEGGKEGLGFCVAFNSLGQIATRKIHLKGL